ncbi:MAG: glycosyltransferase family 39 protein [Candidatus Nomurabacteria bacterium]|nr:MAG: glycosyltransferase family 39 protein [Candidatus Nomurabacteria bacterium]
MSHFFHKTFKYLPPIFLGAICLVFFWNRDLAIEMIELSLRFLQINIFLSILILFAYQGIRDTLRRKISFTLLIALAIWVNVWSAVHIERVLIQSTDVSAYLSFFVLVLTLALLFTFTNRLRREKSLEKMQIPSLHYGIVLLAVLIISLVATFTQQRGIFVTILNTPVSAVLYSTALLFFIWLILNNKVIYRERKIEDVAAHDEDSSEKLYRKIRFSHSRFSRIPLLPTLFILFRKKNVLSIFLLALILLNYFAIRVPYFHDSFFIKLHPGKYVSYVPVAQEMYEAKNPFVFRNPAYAGIFGSAEDQEYGTFWRMPVLEWTLAPFFSLRSYFSDESIVRIYLTIVGSFILGSIFLLTRRLFSPLVAIALTYIFSLTPVFNLLTWTTTLDATALCFLLCSVNLYLYGKRDASFIILGFAFLCKLSFVVIGGPLLALLVLFLEKEKMLHLIKLALASFSPYIFFTLFLRSLPAHADEWGRNITMLVVFLLLVLGIYLVLKYPFTKALRLLQRNKKVWRTSLISTGAFFLLLSLFFLRKSLQALGGEFLTDTSLLLNVDFYLQLFDRVRYMSTPFISFVFFISLGTFWFLPRKKFYILLTFFFTSFIFLILASKSIRFAWYYNHIFVLTMVLFVGGVLYQIEKNLVLSKKSTIATFTLILLTMGLTLNPTPEYFLQSKLSQLEVQAIRDVILKNSDANSKAMTYSSEYRVLYLYTHQPFVQLSAISNQAELESLRKDISDLGFPGAMEKYHLSTFIDTKGQNNFISLLYLFTDSTDKIATDRSDLILSKLYEDVEYYDENEENLNTKIDPSKYFQAIGSVQGVSVYEIIDPPSADASDVQ